MGGDGDRHQSKKSSAPARVRHREVPIPDGIPDDWYSSQEFIIKINDVLRGTRAKSIEYRPRGSSSSSGPVLLIQATTSTALNAAGGLMRMHLEHKRTIQNLQGEQQI